MTASLLPCPFCGSDHVVVSPQYYWTGMRNTVLSVEVRHWCDDRQPGIQGSSVTMRAKTEDEAVTKWNRRAGNSDGEYGTR